MSYTNRRYSKKGVSQRNVKVYGSSYWKFRCTIAEERISLILMLAKEAMISLQENNLEQVKDRLSLIIKHCESYIRTYMYKKKSSSNSNGGEKNE